MFKIKRLYLFILQTFLPLFLMTFLICLFIVLMQFLWKYIDELVGKGLDVSVIAELFFYAALTMVPLALPLAILLASLMVFGNLGEHFELTAMKSSGVSLLKVMRPLIVFLIFVSVGAFFFQNDILPRAQVKMWTLLFSMRQKSPELDIPEETFYQQIEGYNLFVKQKNKETGMLYNLMIYDVSKGYGYANIIVSDSGKLSFTDDKKYLYLQLYQGESFEDLRDEQPVGGTAGVLYRRESFRDKQILIPFDASFNRMDDETMRSQYVGKNLTELQHTIDSVGLKVDSVGRNLADQLKSQEICGVPQQQVIYRDNKRVAEPIPVVKMNVPLNVDSLFASVSPQDQQRLLERALTTSESVRQDYEFKGMAMSDSQETIRRHQIEMQKKFTLSFACLIFFFIGAPLGAIIRKGGLGVPIVISVLLFIVYYIIDNSGYKLARDGRWIVWQGMWLSSAVLLPLGIFFTYKAVNDSVVFNPDAYTNFFKRLLGQHRVRHLVMKELVMDDVVPAVALEKLRHAESLCGKFLENTKLRQSYVEYWIHGFDNKRLHELSETIEDIATYLENSQNQLVINKVMDFPIIKPHVIYHPVNSASLGWIFILVFPLGLPLYLIGASRQKSLKQNIDVSKSVCGELVKMIEHE